MNGLTKLAVLATACLFSASALAYDRIVVLSGDIGDIVVALGDSNKVIGKETAYKHPKLAKVSNIGIHRNLTAEPIVALKPDLVLGSYMVQPASLYQRLNSLNVKTVNVMPDEKVASYASAIQTVGKLLDKETQANKLATNWQQGMNAKPATKKRYLLSYDGRFVAGRGTVGDELIRRAGGINAATVDGLKPLSREGWLASKPDVIIVAAHNQAILGTIEQFKKRPEVATSPAAKTGKVYYWQANDFLRFGLDSPQIVNKLHALAK
ncbi:periplasmic binding protein [Moraxella macacae 0408225]|uniref:Periplasmic binding protein n=1 Tax=Moraxella macacae 0408225 TaxID=1230338 RepID=L2FA90_9GAMM|nr:ABC transporter substrate-binding protein [Moraxella macacae]ELA09661.1 periplasmic binding protein [Moraxella macacae 0408225]